MDTLSHLIEIKDIYKSFGDLSVLRGAWRIFLLQLSLQVTDAFDRLTSDKRVRVFILGDSILSRSRTKKAELLARIFDHTSQKL